MPNVTSSGQPSASSTGGTIAKPVEWHTVVRYILSTQEPAAAQSFREV